MDQAEFLSSSITLTCNLPEARNLKSRWSLGLAASGRFSGSASQKLEWDLMVCREDNREDYGELRLQCFAPIADQLYCVICTEDADHYRIISLRAATPKEVRNYVRHRQEW